MGGKRTLVLIGFATDPLASRFFDAARLRHRFNTLLKKFVRLPQRLSVFGGAEPFGRLNQTEADPEPFSASPR
jgi:hypothetical protein